jgi:hypothetical protein
MAVGSEALQGSRFSFACRKKLDSRHNQPWEIAKVKGLRPVPEPFLLVVLVVVAMNYGLAAITIRIFLLDHGRPITWLALLDDRGTITVAVTVVRFTNRYASSDRAYANTNILSKCRRRYDANQGGSK